MFLHVKDSGRRPKKGCPFSILPKSSPFQGGRANAARQETGESKPGEREPDDLPSKQQGWGTPLPAPWDEPASYISHSSEEENRDSHRTRTRVPLPFPPTVSGTYSLARCGTLLGWSFSFLTLKKSLDLVFPRPRGSRPS